MKIFYLNVLQSRVRISGSLRWWQYLRRVKMPVRRSRQYHTWVCVPSPQDREQTDQPASSQAKWSPFSVNPSGFFFRWDLGGMLHVTVTFVCSLLAPGTIYSRFDSWIILDFNICRDNWKGRVSNSEWTEKWINKDHKGNVGQERSFGANSFLAEHGMVRETGARDDHMNSNDVFCKRESAVQEPRLRMARFQRQPVWTVRLLLDADVARSSRNDHHSTVSYNLSSIFFKSMNKVIFICNKNLTNNLMKYLIN